jgi:hypothetical protein
MATKGGSGRIKLGFATAASMVWRYAVARVKPHFLVFASLLAYLFAFQALVLGRPIVGAAGIALGCGLCVIGISAFLEGIFLGLMPLGEACGLALPLRAGPAAIAAFSLILGVTATLAEPAIAFLKIAGASVLPWRAPLLHFILNRGSAYLLGAIALGVGLAVALGVLRFIRRWPFRPLLFAVLGACLAASVLAALDPKVSAILALAWDSGGITTGPVTVPLVLALGIGLSRASGGRSGVSEGFGIVTLASLMPVVAVVALGFCLSPRVPAAMDEAQFFSAERRAEALAFFKDEDALRSFARSRLSPIDFSLAGFDVPATPAMPAAPGTLTDPGPAEGAATVPARSVATIPAPARAASLAIALRDGLVASARAVLPLAALLVAAMAFLRKRIRQKDELVLGIALSLAGMAVFTFGMGAGLNEIGSQSGRLLPMAYSAMKDEASARTINDFDPAMLVRATGGEGGSTRLVLINEEGGLKAVPYEEKNYDPAARTYRTDNILGPLFSGGRAPLGIALVLLFAFFLGYGATMAEPSLSALGAAVEETSVGAFKRGALVRATAAGVGLGMALGFCRAMADVPIAFVLIPAYAILALLTALSDDGFSALAWDAAGVTTGPITVPLVISTGLALGARTGAAESFGILACASAIPIGAVLAMGLRLAYSGSRREGARAPRGGKA